MAQLDKMINSDAEPNRKAESKIRYAIGLRNSFGRCWYLTTYGYNMGLSYWEWHTSSDRNGFKNNTYAQRAYRIVDTLMDEAVSEFTDPEKAAQITDLLLTRGCCRIHPKFRFCNTLLLLSFAFFGVELFWGRARRALATFRIAGNILFPTQGYQPLDIVRYKMHELSIFNFYKVNQNNPIIQIN